MDIQYEGELRLPSQIRDEETRRAVLAAAEADPELTAALKACAAQWPESEHRLSAFFEHGHWWVEIPSAGRAWSVIDIETAEGDAFGFELTSEGDLES